MRVGYWKNQLLQGDPSTRHYALTARPLLPGCRRANAAQVGSPGVRQHPFSASPPSGPGPDRQGRRTSRCSASASGNSVAPATSATPPTWPPTTWTPNSRAPASRPPACRYHPAPRPPCRQRRQLIQSGAGAGFHLNLLVNFNPEPSGSRFILRHGRLLYLNNFFLRIFTIEQSPLDARLA